MHPLQFVILHHQEIPEPHFDLMFETRAGSELVTWRSDAWPIERPTRLTRLKDHRRLYLEYEGPLSRRRGTVSRVARGTCRVEVGENAVWTITLLSGAPSATLEFRQVAAEQWEGRVQPHG